MRRSRFGLVAVLVVALQASCLTYVAKCSTLTPLAKQLLIEGANLPARYSY